VTDELPTSYASQFDVVVRWGETDAAGIAWSPHYFAWFDHATHALFEALGYPPHELLAGGRNSIPILHADARFVRPATFGERITIGTNLAEVRSRSVALEHFGTVDGELVVHGHEIRGFAEVKHGDRTQLQLVPWPDDLALAMMQRQI